jgi:MerR family transcriptional regulator/heat shock protein HspR
VTDRDAWTSGGGIAADRGVFGISVAAELAGVPVQSLRLFESRGLLEPARTEGGTRRYSSDDIDRVRYINQLKADGLNLAGIGAVLALEDRNQTLAAENAALQAEILRLRQSRQSRAATSDGADRKRGPASKT